MCFDILINNSLGFFLCISALLRWLNSREPLERCWHRLTHKDQLFSFIFSYSLVSTFCSYWSILTYCIYQWIHTSEVSKYWTNFLLQQIREEHLFSDQFNLLSLNRLLTKRWTLTYLNPSAKRSLRILTMFFLNIKYPALLLYTFSQLPLIWLVKVFFVKSLKVINVCKYEKSNV